jgi:hypothetical protein
LESIQILTLEISSFELAWLFFSLLICVFLLKRVEGATTATWLLPLIILTYSFDNQWNGTPLSISPDIKLFPSEKKIIEFYLKEPLGTTVLEQQQQLLNGWNLFLVSEWAHEIPSKVLEEFTLQVEKGKFRFTVARLKELHETIKKTLNRGAFPKTSPIILAGYIIWNIFFAWFVNIKYFDESVKPNYFKSV